MTTHLHRHGLVRVAQSTAGLLLFVVLWEVGALLAHSPTVFPGAIDTARAACALLAEGYLADFLATALRALSSWLVALALGVLIGLLLAATSAYDFSQGVLALLRSLPAFMLVTIPVAMGLGGELSRLLTTAAAAFLIISDECASSLATVPQDRIELARLYGGSRWFIVRRILLFEALGRAVVPAARTSVGIAFVVTIVCETLVIPRTGVGARLLTALSALEMPAVYAFLLLTGAVGLALNVVVDALARRLVYWT